MKEDVMSLPNNQNTKTSLKPSMGSEEKVKMTRLRQTIARRLKESQNTAAMLTTYNEADMTGGTFTISNGGIYGSLMSSPILNSPESGILGMHKIQERPMAIDGKIEILPMMYLALSYDHRIVDGKGAVTFLVRVKENLEDPRRLLIDL